MLPLTSLTVVAVSAVVVFLLTTRTAGASTNCSRNCIGTQVVVCAKDQDGKVRQFGNSCAVQQYNCAYGTSWKVESYLDERYLLVGMGLQEGNLQSRSLNINSNLNLAAT
uniref:Secreted protein n=1 Tax=Timema genevievae TaxID=629358 RepID=A0A7R9K0V5_TIMGE|nr:unnamed protein product [Timema genevievae]